MHQVYFDGKGMLWLFLSVPSIFDDRQTSGSLQRDLRLCAHAALGLPSDLRDRRYFDHFRFRSSLESSGVLDTCF